VRLVLGKSGMDAKASGVEPDTPIGSPGTVMWVLIPPGSGPATIAHELCHCVGVHHHGEGDYAALWTWKQDLRGNWQLYEQPFDRDNMEGAPSFYPNHPPAPIRAIREADLSEITHDNIGKYLQGNYYDPWGGYRMLVGVKGGAYSGEERCVMRYPDADAYVSSEEPDVRYLPWASEYKGRDTLCDGQAGTGYNSKDHHPESRYGDAKVGKCKEQIVVSDK
jgi:hypothetical protein